MINRFPPNLGCGCFSSCSTDTWYPNRWNAKKFFVMSLLNLYSINGLRANSKFLSKIKYFPDQPTRLSGLYVTGTKQLFLSMKKRANIQNFSVLLQVMDYAGLEKTGKTGSSLPFDFLWFGGKNIKKYLKGKSSHTEGKSTLLEGNFAQLAGKWTIFPGLMIMCIGIAP